MSDALASGFLRAFQSMVPKKHSKVIVAGNQTFQLEDLRMSADSMATGEGRELLHALIDAVDEAAIAQQLAEVKAENADLRGDVKTALATLRSMQSRLTAADLQQQLKDVIDELDANIS